MKIPHWLVMALQRMVDAVYKYKPEPVPGKDRLMQCKIISHRGEHDNRVVFENTIEAFELAKDAGVWGIELDVRWTRDLKPVVFHDDHTGRLYGDKKYISQTDFMDLRTRFPQVPALEEVIQLYGGRLHLMVEIKKEQYPDPRRQRRTLQDLFSSLSPHDDYHLISLSPEIFEVFDFLPRSACFPIAEFNIRQMSRLAIKKGYGGVLGHYLLTTQSILREHREIGQRIGTGYIGSKNCLFHEMNRNIEWIFSNSAVKIQTILDSCLEAASGHGTGN